jgi:hypothetical protein
MTTLIAVYTAQGCVGRCDARCYEAHEPVCTCVCGGRNHGKGLDTSKAQTRANAPVWISAYARSHQLEHYSSEVHQDCYQLSLWRSADE